MADEILGLTLLFCLLCAVGSAAEIVELKVTPPIGPSPMPAMLGVPFAEGALDSPRHVRLLDPSGNETPSQMSVMSRWLSGGVKWLRLEWICPGGGGEKTYRLEFGAAVKRVDYPTKLRLRDDAEALEVATGALVLVRGKQTTSPFDRVLGSDGKTLAEAAIVRVMDAIGKEWRSADSPPESVVVESSGAIRATILCRSLLKRADSQAAYRCDTRVSVFSGLSLVKLSHTLQPVGGPETHGLREVALTLRPTAKGGQSVVFGGAAEPHTLSAGPAHLIAKLDLTYALCVGEKTAATGERAPGWMAASGLLVAVRDFWELNQKSLEVSPDGTVTVGLWSRHASATLKMPRTRAITHDLWLDFGAPGQIKQRAEDILNAKLPVAPPVYFCATRALGDLSPAPSKLCPEYDEKVNAAFAKWQEREQKDVHAFGLNHYGDYILYNAYGRAYGYGANEYDAPHALFLQYARTGNQAFLNRAVAAARHMADMDVNHGTGQMFFHGYGDGWDDHEHLRAIGGLDHTFGDGLLDYAFVTGDPRGLEVGLQVADAAQKYVGEGEDMTVCRNLMAGAERSLGWPLLLLVRYYEDTGDAKYLRSARKLADYLHHWATRTEEELEKGRWLRTWLQDGCKTFMSSVVGEGLVRYHAAAQDAKATEALTAGLDWLVEKMWYPEYGGFMYEYNAFIPGHRDSFGAEMMTLQMLGYAYKVTKNPRYLRIGLDVLRRGGIGSDGKSFSMPTRNAPHFVAFLDQSGIDPKTAEPETKPPPPDPVKPERLELPGLTVSLTDAALVEAESAVLAEGIEAVVKPKAQASGDKALRVTGKGKGALHWTLRVPQAGDYLLALRYRCDHEKWPVMREVELLIDDASIPGAANPTRLWYVNRRPTLMSEWDFGVPSTADSMPVPARLSAGEHKVTLRDPQQVFELDAVLLIPVTPEQAAELARARSPVPSSHVVFHVPLDGTLKAAVARAEPEPRLEGDARFEPGVKGRGLLAAGATRVTYDAVGNFPADRGTVMFWFKPNFSMAQDMLSRRCFLHVSGDHYMANAVSLLTMYHDLHIRLHAPDGRLIGEAGCNVLTWKKGEWHHLAFTWGAERLCLYVDGRLEAAARMSKPLARGHTRLQLGHRPSGWVADSVLNKFTVYDLPLSPAQVRQAYQASRAAAR